MAGQGKIFLGENVCVEGELKPAAIFVRDGKIIEILDKSNLDSNDYPDCQITDVGSDNILMPGVVDSHVHVNEPGRTEWEGYQTATRAAAVGGVTTIIDMPLNSIPATTSLQALRTKLQVAERKCHVDVGFWGGIVPDNQDELIPMLKSGVAGFKCFLIHSGVDELPAVTLNDLEKALDILQGTSTVVLFHAEMVCGGDSLPADIQHKDPRIYQTFLETRPEAMEVYAIKMVCDLCLKYRVRCHIVHLSAATAIPIIAQAKQQGAPLTVETTFHYLTLQTEDIPDGATEFKCCPPIRDRINQTALWQGILDGHIDMVVSDHSPCTPDLKQLEQGDFMSAWGGISSLQFGLSLMWTHGQRHGLKVQDLVKLLCENTAKLTGIGHRKGRIATGYDADFVVWNPDKFYTVKGEDILHKHKVTPYLGQTIQGVVMLTVLRGEVIYDSGKFPSQRQGKFLLVDQAGSLQSDH